MEELSEEDRKVVYRARKAQRFLSQPIYGRQFTESRENADIEIRQRFTMILDGELDDFPKLPLIW